VRQKRIAMLLVNDTNDYQQVIRTDAESAARSQGMTVDFHFAQDDLVLQIRQLYACTRSDPGDRPELIFLFPVRDGAFENALRDACHAGVGCTFLNRRPRYLRDLRREFPALPLGSIGPDQVEIGRIQGGQALSLVPPGGLVLYVLGSSLASASEDRAQGFRQVLKASSIRWSEVHGDWDTAVAEKAVQRWLQLVLISDQKLGAVVCQNDAMAVGARRALERAASELHRPELRGLKVTGVDGLASGQALVTQGTLAGTILQTSSGRPAVEWAARWLDGDAPALDVVLPVTPYPSLPRSLAPSV
jgi:ABC-type sugar transport system substrate-binding protein